MRTLTRSRNISFASGSLRPFTAADLGALDAWNAGQPAGKGEFNKLSKPYSDTKPGKLAYALEYKLVHGLS